MLLTSSGRKRALMHLCLFTNFAQRWLVSICTQSIRNCHHSSLHFRLVCKFNNEFNWKYCLSYATRIKNNVIIPTVIAKVYATRRMISIYILGLGWYCQGVRFPQDDFYIYFFGRYCQGVRFPQDDFDIYFRFWPILPRCTLPAGWFSYIF